MKEMTANNKPMLNAYPDSIGGTLEDIVEVLKHPELKNAFASFYILPSLFHTDLDRGFSVISYDLNEALASKEDLKALEELGIDLKLDFILNHASVLSKQFQDIIKNGDQSKYKDFFIDWNKFWDGCGSMTEQGYVQPDEKYIKDMFFRKPGLPILMVRFPDGREVPYWNTFYQEVKYPVFDAQDFMSVMNIQYYQADQLAKKVNTMIAEKGKIEKALLSEETVDYVESRRKYLGQMDLNIKSDLVWQYYDEVLGQLAKYGAKIVRLDAFAYAPKEPGLKNFLNEPGTWEVLKKVQAIADKYQLSLLPEIHASYGEGKYNDIASRGYMVYDFFLPGLVIDAIENHDASTLTKWAEEIIAKGMKTINMLGCHDGIPLLDLKGLVDEARIQNLIDTVVERGGYVKDLHGAKNMYYQVNATYYSALGEDDRKMLLARALQLFMPGKPQVWYLDLFAGKNDHEAVRLAGSGGHKEINRTNLKREMIEEGLTRELVKKQLELLRYRGEFEAFSFDSEITVNQNKDQLIFVWTKAGNKAVLEANLTDYSFKVIGINEHGEQVYEFVQEA